jgi:PAS domain S-box-containing protein
MNTEKFADLQSLKLLEEKIQQLERRVEREKSARKQAEIILEFKSLELYNTNRSLAVANENLEFQLQRNKEFLNSINDISGYLIGKNNLTDIAKTVTKRLISKYDLEDCVIYKVENGYCYQISAIGSKSKNKSEVHEPLAIKVGEGIVGTVAQTGIAEIVNDTSIDPRYIVDDAIRLSELSVPIEYEGTVIGVIDTEHSKANFFNEDQLRTITTIASLISVIFKNSLTEEKNLTLQSDFDRRSEILNSLVENLHSGLLLNDENGKIILVNELFSNIFQFYIPLDQIIGKDQRKSSELVKHQFVDPDEFMSILDYCKKHNKEVTRRELAMTNGSIYDCKFIPIYSKGEFIGQLWKMTDVTESRIANNKLRISEEKYRGIIENMELGLLEVDTNHRILKVYDWFCLMTGYTQDELIGRDARETLLPDNYKEVMDAQDALRSKGEQSIYEVQLKKKNGELFWVIISGAPFYDQFGNVAGSIGIHYNIDSRKKLEEELKLSKIQTEKARKAEKQFLANMSHEIRNPLNAIIGIANLLYDTDLNKQQLEHLNKIKYSSDILLGLISGILDISKIESGTLELIEREIDISEIVNGLIQIGGFNAKAKKLTYINDLASSGEFRVLADPTVMNQIFINLINNATKFTDSGNITISGSINEIDDEYSNFDFVVSDTGIGISNDKLESIFDKFQQADHESKLKYGGTGLGLNIVKKLVSMYGGEIKASSLLNFGTSMYFNLKLKTKKQSSISEKNIHFAVKNQCRLLVVEDNEINQYYLSGILNKWKIEHDIAKDGFEALEALEKENYNLILMDIRMPRMNGYETTIKLRSMKNNQNSLKPIIALTASALVDERENALKAGMNYHLTKPYTENDLGEVLSKFGIIQIIDGEVLDTFSFSKELDRQYLETYYEGDLERAYAMFKIFVRVIDEDFQKLKTAILNENWDQVSAISHKIKPNFAMVGLAKLSNEMEKLEKAKINSEVKADINRNFLKLETEFDLGKELIISELDRITKKLKK